MIAQNYNRSTNVAMEHNIMFTQPLAPIRPIGRIYETNINNLKQK